MILNDFDYKMKRANASWKTRQVLYFIFIPLMFVLGLLFIIFRGNLIGLIYDLLAGITCLVCVGLSPIFYSYEKSKYKKKIQAIIKAQNDGFNSVTKDYID